MKKLLIGISLFFLFVGILLIIPIFLSNEISFKLGGKILELNKLGTIGDYLSGTSGLLLSFSGLIFVYLTLKTQIDQLKLQSIDSKLSKELNEIVRLQSIIDNLSQRVSSQIEKSIFSKIDGLKDDFNTPDFLTGFSGITLMANNIQVVIDRLSSLSEEQKKQLNNNINLFCINC